MDEPAQGSDVNPQVLLPASREGGRQYSVRFKGEDTDPEKSHTEPDSDLSWCRFPLCHTLLAPEAPGGDHLPLHTDPPGTPAMCWTSTVPGTSYSRGQHTLSFSCTPGQRAGTPESGVLPSTCECLD